MTIKKIKLVCDKFNIDFNNIERQKFSNPYGNFIAKIDILFKEYNQNILKAKINENHFVFEYFPNQYKIGKNQTWHYIYNGLFFLGLIKDRNYEDDKITSGLHIPEITQFNSLKEYINSSVANDNISRNFKQDPEWFKKLIVGSIYSYSIKKKINSSIFHQEHILKFKEKRYTSKYENMFETLYNIVTNNILLIDENDKKKLNKFAERLTTKSRKEIKKALSEKSEETRTIERLRRQFSKDLEQEFKSYEKLMLNVIDEYAKTFDINIKMTKTDKAHIIPVWYLVKQKRWDDIANPNNGLILDPNTHRLFDKDKNTTIKDNKIYNNYHEFIINDKFLNPERQQFIDEWIEKWKEFK
ncbi:MAG: HNH endonuclease [Mycoplasmatales bacterium]|nr:HNH endonuclease [Mycoplasmatales bacterium]